MTIRMVCVSILCCLALVAADVSGRWKGQMGAGGREVVLTLKAEGSKIRGSMSDADGNARPITKGSLDGDKISLTVASQWEGNPVNLLLKGTVSGDQMKLTVEAEGGGWGTELTAKKVD